MKTKNTKNLKNYIHKIGVARGYYICPNCGDMHMELLLSKYNRTSWDKNYKQIQEVTLQCMNCGEVSINPEWVGISEPFEYEEKPSEPWISFDEMEMIVTLKQFQLN